MNLCKKCHKEILDLNRSELYCGKCLDKYKVDNKKYYLKHKEEFYERSKKRLNEKREEIRKYSSEWTKNNRDKANKYQEKWRRKNGIPKRTKKSKEEIKELNRKYYLSEKGQESAKKSRENNKDKFRIYLKEYYSNPINIEKRKNYLKQWRDKNRSKCAEYSKKYRQKNPNSIILQSQQRRSRIVGEIKRKEWNNLKELYGNKCLKCGSKENLQMDHIIPISKNGLHSINNIQPLCRSCNAKKHTKIEDYRQSAVVQEWT